MEFELKCARGEKLLSAVLVPWPRNAHDDLCYIS